jgi:AcrR family transcriptional regulator
LPSKQDKPATGRAKRTTARSSDGAGARRELVEHKLFEVASELFTERGFTGTSLQDIADAMGVSRPALYYYVKSKDDILARLVEELPLRNAAQLRALRTRSGLPAAEKLHDMTRLQAMNAAAAPIRLRLLDRNEHHLKGKVAKTHATGKRAVLAEFQAAVEEGIRNGEFRPVDARTAALAIIGMCNWVAWWFEPGPENPASPVADQIAETAVRGVAVADERDRSNDPHQLVRQVREGIDRLERLLP